MRSRNWLWPFVNLLGAVCTAQAANLPKVLLIFDMEGISGVVNANYEHYGKPEYIQGRESLTADVNAAIRGLKDGGAGAIVVEDGHGSGNIKEPDVFLDKLDRRAMFEFRDQPFDSYSSGIDGSFDAIVVVGQHARAGTRGFLQHTYTWDVTWIVNGVALSETHLAALHAAAWGIPVIMATGDDVLKDQLAPDFPNLEYAVVKKALSLREAEPVARPEADARIESAARAAMRKLLNGSFRPYHLAAPFDFRLSFQNWEEGQFAAGTRDVSPDGELGVRFFARSFPEGFRIALDVINRALNPLPLLRRILEREPNGKRVLQLLEDIQWTRNDPAAMPEWARPPAPSREKKRYWGGR